MDIASALAIRAQQTASAPTVRLRLARVVSASSTAVVVSVDDETLTVPRVRSYASPAANDVVIVASSGAAAYCLGTLNAAPVPPPDIPEPDDPTPPPAGGGGTTSPKPPPAPTTYSKTFRPNYVGTYRDGWRSDTSNAYQGDWTGRGVNWGSAYYGSGPGALSGTAVGGTVRIKRLAGGANAAQRPTLRLLTNKTRPGGFPNASKTMRGPALGVNGSATVALPATWVAALMNGSAGGIGIGVSSSTPYIQLAGKSSWGASFEITLTYRK